jgi:hypothetical protein
MEKLIHRRSTLPIQRQLEEVLSKHSVEAGRAAPGDMPKLASSLSETGWIPPG